MENEYFISKLEEYNYLYQTSYYSFVKENDAEDCRNVDFILLVHMFYSLINENTKSKKDMSNIRDFIKNNKKVYPAEKGSFLVRESALCALLVSFI